jgi:hypothetical protein
VKLYHTTGQRPCLQQGTPLSEQARYKARSTEHPTKEEFHSELIELSALVEQKMCIKQLCSLVGVDRGSYYKWLRGDNAPILLLRRAMLAVMRELAKP